VHVIGFTLVTGGALVANLNLLGVLFPGRSPMEVTRPASRGIASKSRLFTLPGSRFSVRVQVRFIVRRDVNSSA
jgi:hypothetical protein